MLLTRAEAVAETKSGITAGGGNKKDERKKSRK